MKTLNIIGCGKLGQSLAKLWHTHGSLRIESVLNQSPTSTQAAVTQIGSGTPADTLTSMPTADLWLIASNDGSISSIAQQLTQHPAISTATTVFHCSGALSSTELAPLQEKGARIASIHPIMSFATTATERFAGTFCGCEGDATALATLTPLFEEIGGRCFPISSTYKPLYHAATVMCCNYLTALTAASAELFSKAGVPSELTLELMLPIMRATLENISQQGCVQALTGPIARGDRHTIASHLNNLENSAPELLALYCELGKKTLALSQQQDNASPQDLADIAQILQRQYHR